LNHAFTAWRGSSAQRIVQRAFQPLHFSRQRRADPNVLAAIADVCNCASSLFFFSVFPSSQICSAQLFEGCVAGFDDTSRAYDSSPLFLFSTCGAIICGVLRCRKGAGRALHSDQIAPAFITKSCEIQ
jgi:hypothetical protein